MMSCACSAGPAFEGGDISCGMRATDGAIEACTIDKETMEPSYSVIGREGEKPIGLCGSGIIDVIAELFRTGIINPKGKFVREGKRIRHDEYGMGSYVLAFEEEAGSVKDVEINEVDIDNFIRAKGAIFSAIRTMLAMWQAALAVESIWRMLCELVCSRIFLLKNSTILEILLLRGLIPCFFQETQKENAMIWHRT